MEFTEITVITLITVITVITVIMVISLGMVVSGGRSAWGAAEPSIVNHAYLSFPAIATESP